MRIHCSAKQLAEAVILWSLETGGNPILCMEKEDADDLKHLDLFLSTMNAFKDGFDGKFEIAYDEHKRHFQFSKENFIDYLRPRCLLLAENNGCFDFVMTCAFVSHAVFILSSCNSCFHLSRVACKLLTTVLEERFAGMFTDSGWRNLMSYCRQIHDVVFPSKENRPQGHYLGNIEDSEKKDDEPESKDKSDGEDANCNIELSASQFIQKEGFDCSGGDLEAKLAAMTISNEVGEGNSNDSHDAVDSSDDENSDDESVYWDYEFMSNWTICKRVADSRKHLSDVLDCLDMLKESMDTENISNKYDVPVSDDEDVKKLEKKVVNSDNSEWNFNFSDRAIDSLKMQICEQKNEELGNSSQNQVRAEDVTDEDVFKRFAELLASTPEDEPSCELCDGKIGAFKTKWLESYNERYSHHELISDVI